MRNKPLCALNPLLKFGNAYSDCILAIDHQTYHLRFFTYSSDHYYPTVEPKQITDIKEPVKKPGKKELLKVPDRTVIYPRDIVNIAGISLLAAQRLLRKIRKAVGKPRGAWVTVKEFCAFCYINEEDIQKYLRF
jgi:hypothetical protein